MVQVRIVESSFDLKLEIYGNVYIWSYLRGSQ